MPDDTIGPQPYEVIAVPDSTLRVSFPDSAIFHDLVGLDYVRHPDGSVGVSIQSIYSKLGKFSAGAYLWVAPPGGEDCTIINPSFVDGRVVMNVAERSLEIDSEPIHLTKTELLLFEFFVRNPRQIVSKDQIMEGVWGIDGMVDMDHNVVETYVSYVRRKLGTEFGWLIQTIRGVGYMFTDKPPNEED